MIFNGKAIRNQITVYNKIQVVISGDNLKFPETEQSRLFESEIIGEKLSRGFFIRHCEGDRNIDEEIKLTFQGYSGIL